MTPLEANAILAKAGQYDGRKPDADTAEEWADELTGYRVTDCVAAVRAHYRDTDRWVMPSHLIGRIKGERNDRIERHKWKLRLPAHIADMEDGPEAVIAESRWRAEAIERIANGEIPPEPRALTTGTGYAAAIRAALTPPPAEPSDQGDNTEEQVK